MNNFFFQIVWLISGNDNQIHMIKEDKLSHGYVESRIDKYFPELINLQALVLGISVYYYQNNKMYVGNFVNNRRWFGP